MVERFSYVVVGNGIAGVTAAETLRAEDALADIAIIADNPLPVYNRPGLKDLLAGRVAEEKLWMRPKSFYQDLRIRLIMEHVVSIDVEQHNLYLQNGRQVGYHRLLLATGAHAKRLSRPGTNLVGVTTLRTIADYQNVLNYLGNVQRVVVTGSGPLALESVEALYQKGYQVSHLLRHTLLLSEVLDKTATDLVLQQEWRDGIDIRIEEEIAEVVGKNGHVTGVMTTKGTFIPCEMVVVAIGSEPALDYIQESGIAFGRGVKIDGSMRTNAPDIFAAGEVAEVTNVESGQTYVIGQWYPALQQGRAAAYSMLDILDVSHLAHPFTGSGAYLNAISAMPLYTIDFAAVGHTTIPGDRQGYEEIAYGPTARAYRKVVLKDGIPTGLFSLGERTDILAFKRAIDHRVNLASVAPHLFADDFKFTDWLDSLKVPTPILAVRKVRNASRNMALALTSIPGTKSQFVRVGNSKERFHKQEKQNTMAPQSNANPYALPIVSVSWPEEDDATKAFLVPVFPTAHIGADQQSQELGYKYIDPVWMETPLNPSQSLIIGRENDATLIINHHAVSRRHAEIIHSKGFYLLRDLGSRNGTFLNDQRLEPFSVHILNAHDKIRIGKLMTYTLQFRPVNDSGEAFHYPNNG